MKDDKIIQRRELRTQFNQKVDRGELDFATASKILRKILDKNQKEFSELVGVSKKVISDLETKQGNPTTETINKIFSPIGLKAGLVRKKMN